MYATCTRTALANKVPVLIVPTTSVDLQSINDFAHMLDVGQDVFAFQVTPPLAFQRTPNELEFARPLRARRLG